MKKVKILLISIPLAILLSSWGGTGHYIISSSISKFLNEEMEAFQDWVEYLYIHASDADYRKSDDPSEGPKHYIDIDNYPEFIANGYISPNLGELIEKHGNEFVEQNGYLPWATLASYDSLVQCLVRRDFEKAKKNAADLGHYVADGHMPMHLTVNYNGQFTDNYGIHSRYESQMVNEFATNIDYQGVNIHEIDDVEDYIFNYIYENYPYVDSILDADNTAKQVSSNTSSEAYTEALWNETQAFTIELFKNASLRFTELIYKAWIESGKVPLNAPLNLNKQAKNSKPSLQTYPNPAFNHTNIVFETRSHGNVTIALNSTDGKVSDILFASTKSPGKHVLNINTNAYPAGSYILMLHTENLVTTQAFIICN
ncbi:MAG: T9SS type A sorting domain-containing protein [Bacteroidales bacterium]